MISRILVVADYPIGFASGFGETLYNLFLGFPSDSLISLHPSQHEPGPDKRHGQYLSFELPRQAQHNSWWSYIASKLQLKIEQQVAGQRLDSVIRDIIDRYQISHLLIIPVTPWIAAAALRAVTSKPKVKLVSYVMDDWQGHHQVHGLPFTPWRERLLRKIHIKASARFAVSREMSQEYSKKYGLHWNTVHNGVSVSGRRQVETHKPGPVRILYAGGVNVFRLDAILAFCSALDLCSAENGGNVKLTIMGEVDTPTASVLRQFRSVEVVQAEDHQGALSRMRASDYLYLPLAFAKSAARISSYSMPTKLPEYLAAGPPVIFHAPTDSAVCRFASRNNLHPVLSTMDERELKMFIVSLMFKDPYGPDWQVRARAASKNEFDIAKIRALFQEAFSD